MIQGRASVAMFENISNTGPAPIVDQHFISNLDSYILSYGHNLSNIGKIDTGGPFNLFKIDRTFSSIDLRPVNSSGHWWLGGKFTCDTGYLTKMPPLGDANIAVANLIAKLRYAAPHAIAMSNPTRPESQILVAVLDTAKDGLPHAVSSTLWRDQTHLARKAGDEYLNVEFGWKPLVKDIKDFSRTVLNSSQQIKQYESGSGKRQRRGFHFSSPQKESTFEVSYPFSTFPANPFIFHPSPTMRSVSYDDQIWFEGAFRYYLAPSGVERYAQLASKLFGVSLTPDILWELAPWTWAMDWFGNTGDIIANISYLGSDASVMEWGYMMGHSLMHSQITQDLHGQQVSGITGHPDTAGKTFPLHISENVSVKTRIAGSPYSFAVDPAMLTAKQSAILVALGLSHLA